MKKIGKWILPALGALLLLAGCGDQTEERVLTVELPGGAASASFTGTVREGVGRGVLRFADWIYEGTFYENGALIAGEADDYPWSLVMTGEEMPGRYDGALENGSPVGLGVFHCDNGGVFSGRIRGIAAEEGTAEALPCTVNWQQGRYAGCYDGPLANGLPSGTGAFSGTNAAGQVLRWEGGWDAGEMTGAGTLTAARLMTTVEGREQMGAYSGDALAGVPEGEGEFRSVDETGVAYTYTGEWKAGQMEGRGELRFQAEDRYVRTGDFTGGSFTPTWIDALQVLGTMDPKFTLTEAQTAFLRDHPELWEAESRENFADSEYTRQTDRRLTLKSCFDTPETMAEPRWMLCYSLRIMDAYSGPAFPGGPVVTRITATESTYTRVIRIIVPGTVNGAASNAWMHVIGVPLQLSTYTTVLGQENTCLVMVAGDVRITR